MRFLDTKEEWLSLSGLLLVSSNGPVPETQQPLP
jgi:hypothetical protein